MSADKFSNGTKFKFKGTNQVRNITHPQSDETAKSRLFGSRPDLVVFDEVAEIPEAVWYKRSPHVR